MTAGRARLVALLILTLILSATQCVTACTAESFRPTVPPCHQQHTSVSACVQDFELPVTHALPIHMAAVGFHRPTVEKTLAVLGAPLWETISASPPDLSLSASRILRI
jgi:hypothetical protein